MAPEIAERRVAVIIEDDADIRNLLEAVLTQAGFETVTTGNGLDGIAAVRAHNPVVTTLDVSMPGMDGFETARRIRDFSTTYLVMLTARDDEIDTLQGLDAGADDYVTKPFRPRELRARIEAMLRRPRQPVTADATAPAPVPAPVPAASAGSASTLQDATASQQFDTSTVERVPPFAATMPVSLADPGSTGFDATAAAVPGTSTLVRDELGAVADADSAPLGAPPAGGWFEHNGLRLNPEERLVQLAGVQLELTRTEFDLIHALLESQRRVRSKNDLALLLRGEAYASSYPVNEADRRAVEVHMGNLRRKLGDSTASPRWLETVRGVGYRLAAAQ